jgi:hypothetical protein
MDIDTDLTENCICPYCGYEDTDSWELSGDDGETNETTCGSCGEDFEYSRNITITFSSSKLKCETCDLGSPQVWEHSKIPGRFMKMQECKICKRSQSNIISIEEYKLLNTL